MSFTFKVDDVKPAEQTPYWLSDRGTKCTSIKALSHLLGEKTPTSEASSSNCKSWHTIIPTTSNPLISTALTSYNYHYPLSLSPDDIWLTIAQGFAIHINENAEKYRKRFVDHEGKKEITVRRDEFVKGSPDNDWQGAFSEFSDQIEKYIGKKRDLIVSEFSTTGPIEKAASEIVLMDAMKNYFEYTCHTCCGIPEITLLGSVDDWKKVRTKAQALSEYDLEWWTDNLVKILDQFVDASSGKVDIEFWGNIAKYGGTHGSGAITFVDGWVENLFPYLQIGEGTGHSFIRNRFIIPNFLYYKEEQKLRESGERTIHLGNSNVKVYLGMGYSGNPSGGPQEKDFPIGVSKVPFKWMYYTEEFKMEFLAGFFGVSQNPKTYEVSPIIGWAVRPEPK